MNRLLIFNFRHRIPSTFFNGCLENLPKCSVDLFVNYQTSISNSNNAISFQAKRCFTSKSHSALPKERRIPSKGSYNKSSLVLPTNGEEEIQFLSNFQLASKFVKSSAITELIQVAKSKRHSFSGPFCCELCSILSEWITEEKKLHIVNTLRVLHVHQYLNVPVNSQMNRAIGKWLRTDELNHLKYNVYFTLISMLPYLPSLDLTNEQLTLLASAGEKYIQEPQVSNYDLITFLWCWTNMNESIKLSQCCPEVFQLWFHFTVPRIPQLTEKQCSQCFVALGKEGELPPLEWRKEVTKKILTFKSLDTQQCSNFAMSISKLPDLIPNDSDRTMFLKTLFGSYYGYVQKNDRIYPQHLSNICCALTVLHKSNVTNFKPPKQFWNATLNAKFVGKFNDEGVVQIVNSMAEFNVQNAPSLFLEKLFSDFKATKPGLASLILYGIFNTNYREKIPQSVIRDCFKVWHKGMADLPFEQLTFPRYALNELYSDFNLKPTDIIADFGPSFWREIERRLHQNEVEREKHIFYLIKPHLIFNDVPIDLLNQLLKLTKVNSDSAEGAANMLWLYGRLSEYEKVEIPNDLLKYNFKVWFAGLDSLLKGHLVKGLWGLHHHDINPCTVIPNFWSLYWKKIEKKSLVRENRNMLRSSVQKFADEISEDLLKNYMNK